MKTRIVAVAVLAATLAAFAPPTDAAEAVAADSEILRKLDLSVLRGRAEEQDLDQIQSLLRKNPNNAEMHFLAGQMLTIRGFENLAIEQYNLSNKKDPTFFLEQFKKRLGLNPKYAYPLALYAIKHYPSDSAVLYIQGRHAVDQDKPGTAADFFVAALEAQPVWPGVHSDLAQLLLKENRIHDALLHANLALQNNPRDFDAQWVKAVAMAELSGKPELAVNQLSQLAPRNWTNDRVALTLAKGYIRSGQYEKAVQPTLAAIKFGKAKTVEEGQQLLAVLISHVSKKTIIADINRISPLNAKDAMSTVLRMRLAHVLSELGAHEEAMKMLLQALQMHAFFAPALNFRIAEELEAQKEDKAALFFYKTAYEMTPDDEKFQMAYIRAATRLQNKSNDLARRIKSLINPSSGS